TVECGSVLVGVVSVGVVGSGVVGSGVVVAGVVVAGITGDEVSVSSSPSDDVAGRDSCSDGCCDCSGCWSDCSCDGRCGVSGARPSPPSVSCSVSPSVSITEVGASQISPTASPRPPRSGVSAAWETPESRNTEATAAAPATLPPRRATLIRMSELLSSPECPYTPRTPQNAEEHSVIDVLRFLQCRLRSASRGRVGRAEHVRRVVEDPTRGIVIPCLPDQVDGGAVDLPDDLDADSDDDQIAHDHGCQEPV